MTKAVLSSQFSVLSSQLLATIARIAKVLCLPEA
jgi:hypothetical protein